MRKFILIIFVIFISNYGKSQEKWQKKPVKFPIPICYGSDISYHTKVEAPQEYLNRLKSTAEKKSDIIVYFDDEFNANSKAKNDFLQAVDIWEYLIKSSVPIYLYAYWTDLEEGVLGSCGPWEFYENFDEAPFKDTYYPVALVEKMKGEEITGSNLPDMIAFFNSSNDKWHFSDDGTLPDDKYDFTTVVLHEIAHGLGYTGMANVDDKNRGYFGSTLLIPGVFDRFIYNSENQFITNQELFTNLSSELYSQFTSRELYFDSPIAYENAGLDSNPRLYAPGGWDDGSSIYHLDESTYEAGDKNSLMTPSLGMGEDNKNPGPLALGMLYEMGWRFLQIKHEPQIDFEQISDLKTLEIYLNSDYDLDSTKLFLITSKDDFQTADSVLLTKTDILTKFESNLPFTEQSSLKYYISASDVKNRTFTYPGTAPEKAFSVTYGPDYYRPSITHTPVNFMTDSDESVEISAEVTDNIGVKIVKIEYFLNENSPTIQEMTLDSDDTYLATLSFAAGSLTVGDSIQYRIIAEDSSSQNNIKYDPVDGYHKFYIQGFMAPVKEYFTDFNDGVNDFISDYFTVETSSEFDDNALHTKHPYDSPNQDNTEYNFVAQLKYPIIIKGGGMMEFDEVVLVEIGEVGNKYGDDEFWDYVIVEGSKDNGETWYPLVDGYDSGLYLSWKTAYNNDTDGNKDLFINRKFALENDNFEEGDTIIIQFRLFSDPYSNGWGWCIDNLNIQDPETSSDLLAISSGELSFFPNPVNEKLILQGAFKQPVGDVILRVHNHIGQLIYNEQISINGVYMNQSVDFKNYKSGIYIVTMQFENGQTISRKIIKD